MSKKEADSPNDYSVTTWAGCAGCAGSKDAKVEQATFNHPSAICMKQGKHTTYFIADGKNNSIRKIFNNEVSTMVLKGEAEFPDGTFLRNPFGICYSKSGDSLYVADVEHHRILSIKSDGTTKTLVGDYKCSSQRLCGPHDVIEEKNGLVIADTFSHQVKSFSFEDSKLSTLAGSSEGFNDGNLEEAKFSKPMGVTVDNKGNIYVCDTGNYKIRKVTPQGVVTTIAGSSKGHEDGLGKEAKFGRPTGIKYAKSGYLYVTDNDPPCLRKISPTGQVSTITGTGLGHADGPAAKSKFYVLGGLALDPNTEELLVVDTYNYVIRRVQEVK